VSPIAATDRRSVAREPSRSTAPWHDLNIW